MRVPSCGRATSRMRVLLWPTTGVKSRIGSYCRSRIRCGLTAWVPMVLSRKVAPSGGCCATCSAAMAPPAPARLSTATVALPRPRDICAATSRPMMSVLVPAAKGTTRRIGRSGQLGWAWARAGSARPPAAIRLRRFMARFPPRRRGGSARRRPARNGPGSRLLQARANLATQSAAISHTAPLTSAARPARVFSAAWAMKPRPMPVAMEKVKGIASAVSTAGT